MSTKSVFLFLAFTFWGLQSPLAATVKKISNCAAQPEFLRTQGVELKEGLQGLPKGQYVARKADLYVESKNQKQKAYSHHSFLTKKTQLVCAEVTTQKQSTSIYAPVLFKVSAHDQQVESVWQFQMTTSPSQVGVWNQKSRLAKLKFTAQDSFQQIYVYELSPRVFDLLFVQIKEDSTEYLKIRYDRLTQ